MRTIFLALALTSAAAAQKGTCDLNIPIQWTIQTTYVDGTTGNAIQSDGGAFADGQAGVVARINVRNVTYVPSGFDRSEEYQFTTQLHCCAGLIMMNTAAQAVVDKGPDSTVANNRSGRDLAEYAAHLKSNCDRFIGTPRIRPADEPV